MESPSHISTIASLVGDAFGQMAKLFQNEFALAKAELANEIRKVGTNIGLLVGGTLLLIPAVVLLLFGLAAVFISHGVSPAGAYFSSGALGLIIALILIAVAVARIKAMTLVPERTVNQLRKDRQTISEVAR